MHILLVEDDLIISENLKLILEKNSFAVDHISTVKEAFSIAGSEDYDLIILDWMLPDGEGIEVAKNLHSRNVKTPILMLTAKSQLDEKLEGFESGVDDYLTKPFAIEELLVRVKALIRRKFPESKSPITKIKEYELNTNLCSLTKNEKEIKLSPKEYSLIEYLFRNKNKVVSRMDILAHVWDDSADNFNNSVEVYIRFLRKKLNDDGTFIKTVKGRGYLLCED